MNDVEKYLKTGFNAYQNNDYISALKIWQEGIRNSPHPRLYVNVGALMRKMNLHSEALCNYVEAIQNYPKRVDIRMNYINLTNEIGDIGRALGAFDGWSGKESLPVFSDQPIYNDKNHGYTSLNPSEDYKYLLKSYASMHNHEYDKFTGREVFDGVFGLSRHSGSIREFFALLGVRSVLDYGGGKGRQYHDIVVKTPDSREFPNLRTYLNIDSARGWDPGAGVGGTLESEDIFDAVLCLDVLEHCPAQDLPWIIDDLFKRARRGVYMSIGNYSASKRLPDGRNVHITIQPVAWWAGIIARAAQSHPAVRYQAYVAANANDLGVLIRG